MTVRRPGFEQALWLAVLIGSLAVGIFSTHYFWGPLPFPEEALSIPTPISLFAERSATGDVAFHGHIAAGVLALILGPWQFIPAWRQRYNRAHRVLGAVYVCAVGVSAVTAFAVAVEAFGGWPSALGFSLMAALWLLTTGIAVRAILKGNFRSHGRWMLRSMAITFGAVTLRIELGILAGWAQLPIEVAYPIVAWTCWVGNLIALELWLLLKRPRPL